MTCISPLSGIKIRLHLTPVLVLMCSLLISFHSPGLEPITELPFKLHGNYILVQVRINQSAPMDFVFDISAMETIVNADAASQLGLNFTGSRDILTASEIRTVLEVSGQDLQLGGVNIRDVTVLVDSDDSEEFNNGDKIQGIIGFPIISNYVIEIDYDDFVIKLFNPEEYVYMGSGTMVDFTTMYNVPRVNGQIGINDTTTLYGEFLLDTGSDYGLILNTHFLKKNGLLKKLGPHYTIETIKNPRTEFIYSKISGINFASFFLPDISVVYSVGRDGLLAFKTFDGMIGNAILKRFNTWCTTISTQNYTWSQMLFLIMISNLIVQVWF